MFDQTKVERVYMLCSTIKFPIVERSAVGGVVISTQKFWCLLATLLDSTVASGRESPPSAGVPNSQRLVGRIDALHTKKTTLF